MVRSVRCNLRLFLCSANRALLKKKTDAHIMITLMSSTSEVCAGRVVEILASCTPAPREDETEAESSNTTHQIALEDDD